MAGLCAAISSASNLSKTMIVTKTLVGGANTTSIAAGIISAVIGSGKNEDSATRHYEDTIVGGFGINDRALVRTMVNDLPKYLDRLRDYGVELEGGEEPEPRFVPGHSVPRSYYMMGGCVKLQSILKKYAEALGVRFAERTTVTSLVKSGERVVGAVGYSADGSNLVAIRANATILATGGPGELYARTLNPIGSTGYGSSLGLRAGAEVVDMEFVQFYPMMVFEANLPKVFIDYSPLLRYGAVVRNLEGEDILKKRGIKEPYKLTRDTLSIIIYEEMKGPSGERPVLLDCTELDHKTGKDSWVSSNVNGLEKIGIPIRRRKVGISPYAHFFMGGLKADTNGSTNLPGLYAAGESMGGIHGANRIGGNALSACLVFGFRAGLAASLYASTVNPAPTELFVEQSSKVKEALSYNGTLQPDLKGIKDEIRALMWEKVGIIRDGKGLEDAISRFNSLRALSPKSENPVEQLLLPMMLDSAEVTCLGTLLREESRGSHYRRDNPETKDDWEKRIVLKLCEGKCEVRYESV